MGTFPASCAIASSDTPASFGVHGPGEMRSPSGFFSAMPSTESASFLKTSTSAPSSLRYWTRFHVNES